MFKKNTFLITGGTGSFGKRFTEVLIKKYKPKKIIIFIPRFIKQKNTDKHLSLNELLSHPYLHFYSDKFYEKNNLVTEENRSEDITEATQEMIERVFKENNNQEDPLQLKFKNLANKNIYGLINEKIICNANIGSRFINKHHNHLI